MTERVSAQGALLGRYRAEPGHDRFDIAHSMSDLIVEGYRFALELDESPGLRDDLTEKVRR